MFFFCLWPFISVFYVDGWMWTLLFVMRLMWSFDLSCCWKCGGKVFFFKGSVVIVRVAPHVFWCLHDFKVRVLNSGRVTIFDIAENCEMWPQLRSSCRFCKIINCGCMFGLTVKLAKSRWITLILAKATLLSFHCDFAELTVNPNVPFWLNLYFKPCLVTSPRLEGCISSVYWRFYVNIKDHERDWTTTLIAI